MHILFANIFEWIKHYVSLYNFKYLVIFLFNVSQHSKTLKMGENHSKNNMKFVMMMKIDFIRE